MVHSEVSKNNFIIIQNNIHNVRRWNRENAQNILSFTQIEQNNLNLDNMTT